ncbi:histidine phosphatase family protein [Photobacterium japonica]|uniref:histidine phosphatase family protein n=1 Tax=Photobacterium japonica TaxID=2910235 RepID=UPI003D142019
MDYGVVTRIDILRHGLPEGHGCLRGHTDFAITPQGLTQMARAVADIEDIEHVVSSPLQRCSVFAEQYAARYALPQHTATEWMEMDFGEWDGQRHDALWQAQGDVLTQYWQNPWINTPHNGETLPAFDARIQKAWQDLLRAYHGKKVLLVTHAGVMKQLMRIVLDMPENAAYLQRIDLPYAARYRVTVFTDQDGTHWPQIQWPVEQQF